MKKRIEKKTKVMFLDFEKYCREFSVNEGQLPAASYGEFGHDITSFGVNLHAVSCGELNPITRSALPVIEMRKKSHGMPGGFVSIRDRKDLGNEKQKRMDG